MFVLCTELRSPQICNTELLTPYVTLSEDRVFKEVTNVNEVIRGGPQSTIVGVLMRREKDTRERQVYRGKRPSASQGERPWEKPNLLTS